MITFYYLKRKKITIAISDETQRVAAIVKGSFDKYHKSFQLAGAIQPARDDERTYFNNETNTLYVDGLALVDLQVWLLNQRDWKDDKRNFYSAFQRLFGGGYGQRLHDFPKCSVAAAVGASLPGELNYFISQMIEQHPDAFTALQRGDDAHLLEIELPD